MDNEKGFTMSNSDRFIERALAATNRAIACAVVADDLARRQSDLLDDALLETFPASDPVSVFQLA